MNKFTTSIICVLLSAVWVNAESFQEFHIGGTGVNYANGENDQGTNLYYGIALTDSNAPYIGFGVHHQIYTDGTIQKNYGKMSSADIKLGFTFHKFASIYGIGSFGQQDIGDYTIENTRYNILSDGYGYGVGASFFPFSSIGFSFEFLKYHMSYDLQQIKYNMNTFNGSMVLRF